MKSKITGIICVLSILLTIAACDNGNKENRVTIKEPGKSITVIDDAGNTASKPDVSVKKIDRYENVEISDWLNKDTVIVSKENDSLGKMSLAELSDSYPRSLYLYNINTKEYKLLKEQKDVHLGEAALSADKKHLLYSEYSLGDPVYYVMNLDTLKAFGIMGGNIGGAISAGWSGNEVIGAAYSNGAYLANTTGKISVLDGLKEEALFIVKKNKDNVYYNTSNDESLMMLNLSTKKKVNLNLNNVFNVVPSPDGNQLLVLQSSGSKNIMILCDANGGNKKTIAEGTELGGISWSPDQRMIAYNLKGDVNGTTVNGLYVYDMLTDKSTQIAVDIKNAVTSWSPSGEELVYTEWNGKQYNSSIVYLQYSLQK
ncbi:MAG: hypothetical protein K0R50_2183 [Eubacterium sp.]|nr:hypothetical protein [Eubacterium sp.]